MKVLYSLVIFTHLLCGSATAMDKPMHDLRIKVAKVSAPGSITVQINGSSQEVTRIWKDSNSWGAARWRVLLIRKGQLNTFFQNPDQLFTRNIPAFDEIPTGQPIEKRLDLNDGDWRALGGGKANFEPGDMIIVVYDVPTTSEAHEMGVWYGVAATITTFR